MRSKTVIVGEEKQEDFDALAAGWRAEYDDDGQATKSLLERVILNDWFLRRVEQRYIELECELAAKNAFSSPTAHNGHQTPCALGWTEEDHKKMELSLRYKTTNERSFYRALNSLRGLRKDKIREALDFKKMEERADKAVEKALEKKSAERQARPGSVAAAGRGKEIFQGQNHPKKRRKIAVLDQWIEIETQDGKTVTKLYPSNAGLIEEGKRMYPPPEMVYRRLNFPDGIPEEYRWTAGASSPQVERGGMGTQRMTVDTWLEVIEREAARGTGHVGPTGVGNLPRPMERGGCDCEVCKKNREVIERRAGT